MKRLRIQVFDIRSNRNRRTFLFTKKFPFLIINLFIIPSVRFPYNNIYHLSYHFYSHCNVCSTLLHIFFYSKKKKKTNIVDSIVYNKNCLCNIRESKKNCLKLKKSHWMDNIKASHK